MRVTITKGILPDRVVVGFWIGDKVQNVIMSYTELRDVMSSEDVAAIMDESLAVWKANCQIKVI